MPYFYNGLKLLFTPIVKLGRARIIFNITLTVFVNKLWDHYIFVVN